MQFSEAPTINEIVYNRLDIRRQSRCVYMERPSRYKVGDVVKFHFGTIIRSGRISNVMCINGLTFYHIVGENGVWYREIYQSDIITQKQIR